MKKQKPLTPDELMFSFFSAFEFADMLVLSMPDDLKARTRAQFGPLLDMFRAANDTIIDTCEDKGLNGLQFEREDMASEMYDFACRYIQKHRKPRNKKY